MLRRLVYWCVIEIQFVRSVFVYIQFLIVFAQNGDERARCAHCLLYIRLLRLIQIETDARSIFIRQFTVSLLLCMERNFSVLFALLLQNSCFGCDLTQTIAGIFGYSNQDVFRFHFVAHIIRQLMNFTSLVHFVFKSYTYWGGFGFHREGSPCLKFGTITMTLHWNIQFVDGRLIV